MLAFPVLFHAQSPSAVNEASSAAQAAQAGCSQFASFTDPAQRAAAEAELSRSRLLSDAGRLNEAQRAAEHSLRLETTAGGWYQLALVLFGRADARCSLAAFTTAAALRQPDSEELRIVARDYVLLNDEPDAEKWLRVAVSMNGQDGDAWYDLGRVLYSAKRYPAAAEALQQSLAIRPHDARAETYLGLIAEMQNDRSGAEGDYRLAIADEQESRKDFALPYRSLGILQRDAGHEGEAVSLLQRAITMAPDDAASHAELGQCFVKQRRWSDARAELETAIRFHSSKPAWHFDLGRVYHALGMEAEAKAEFEMVKAQLNSSVRQGPEQ